MKEKLKELLERTLNATESLAKEDSVSNEAFNVVLLGVYRISFTTLRDIYYLSLQNECGASILDLTRKMIEYGISIEYMLCRDKNKMATCFQEFSTVQAYREMEFLESIGTAPTDPTDDIHSNIEVLKNKYNALSAKTKSRNNWAGRSIDSMIEYLFEEGALKDFDFSRIGQAYVWGCNLNHANSLVVFNYLDHKDYIIADSHYFNLGILVALSFHLRLTSRLIDESRLIVDKNIYSDIAEKIAIIQKSLDEMK